MRKEMINMRRSIIDGRDPFFENRFSYAVVVRADINEINELKQYLADHGFVICFQKLSTNKLYIKED
jgi:hypothetical protein